MVLTASEQSLKRIYIWCADQLNKGVEDANTSDYDRKEFQQIQIRFLDSVAMYNRLSEQAK